MSCYIIELADCALTPYAIETESGTEYGWGLMPKRKVDLDELLRVADECDAADVDGVTDWAARIRKAMTPPCTQCVHSRFKAFNSVTILCDSGAYLDHVERTCCERYDNFVAIDVRGTRWCRFEQKPPKAEDGDES